MLPIDLPGIEVTSTEPDERLFSVHAGCAGRPDACVVCQSQNFIGHGLYQMELMDLPHQCRYTCIHLTRKRYRCKDCGNTFFHPLDWLDDTHRATKHFVERIAALGLVRNFSDIAREYGISRNTLSGKSSTTVIEKLSTRPDSSRQCIWASMN